MWTDKGSNWWTLSTHINPNNGDWKESPCPKFLMTGMLVLMRWALLSFSLCCYWVVFKVHLHINNMPIAAVWEAGIQYNCGLAIDKINESDLTGNPQQSQSNDGPFDGHCQQSTEWLWYIHCYISTMQLKSEILVLSNKFQRENEKIATQSKLVQLWYSLERVNIFPWKTLYFMLMHKAHDSFVPVTSTTQCSHLPICHSISNLEIFTYPRLKQPPKLKHCCKLEVYFSRSANWPFSERPCFRVIFGWHACRNEASW